MFHFRVFGIPVRVELFFVLIAAYLANGMAGRSLEVEQTLLGIAVIFLAVLLHELGHAFAGKRYGLHPEISLYGAGGLTSWREPIPLSPGRRVFISFAGPLVGIVVGLATIVALIALSGTPDRYLPFPSWNGLLELLSERYYESELIGYVFYATLWANLGWALLNLVPVMPLDGGQMMAAGLTRFFGRRGITIGHGVSIALLAAIGVYYLVGSGGRPSIFNLLILIYLGAINFNALRERSTE